MVDCDLARHGAGRDERWVLNLAAQNAKSQHDKGLQDSEIRGCTLGCTPQTAGLPSVSDPDLAAVIEAWSALPAAMRAGIAGMVRTACSSPNPGPS